MAKAKAQGESRSKKSPRKNAAAEKFERKLTDPFPEEGDPPQQDSQGHTGAKPPEKELSVEVLKAHIQNEIFLYAEYKVNTKDDKGTFKKDGENPVHNDLKNAFGGLVPHLAMLSQQYNSSGQLDNSQITCRGFKIGGNGAGVTLSGTRLLSNGKAFNFNTPFYKWDTEQSESLFPDDAGNLRSAVNTCRAEVIKYLFKHKYQPEVNAE